MYRIYVCVCVCVLCVSIRVMKWVMKRFRLNWWLKRQWDQIARTQLCCPYNIILLPYITTTTHYIMQAVIVSYSSCFMFLCCLGFVILIKYMFVGLMTRRRSVGLWLSTREPVLMWDTPSENGGTVFPHAVSLRGFLSMTLEVTHYSS